MYCMAQGAAQSVSWVWRLLNRLYCQGSWLCWRLAVISDSIPVYHKLCRRFLNFWATVCNIVRLMLSDHCLSCLSCLSVCPVCLSALSVTLVYCGQTIGLIKMKLGKQVGLSPGHIMLHGDSALFSQRDTAPPQFSAHICCGQMAGWIKMPLGMR